MENLAAFSIPFKGMKEGMHQFEYQIDREFFELFEASPIEEGEFTVKLYFDKRPDMFILVFDIEGYMATDCDRCLAPIALPLKTSNQLMVKFSEVPVDEDDVVYLHPDAYEIDLAPFIYEFVCLGIPITKVYDCQSEKNIPCDFDTLDRLEGSQDEIESESPTNPFAEAFKKLRQNKS